MVWLFGFLLGRVSRLVYLMRHPAVPFWLKLLPVVAVAYVIFPNDFFRDFIPVVGYLDDTWVFIMLMSLFMIVGGWYASRTPKRHENTITTTYEVLDPDREDKDDPKEGPPQR